LLVVGGLIIEGVYNKARPDNAHGFTALGLYEYSEVARSLKLCAAIFNFLRARRALGH
jgi:hypothetical protein